MGKGSSRLSRGVIATLTLFVLVWQGASQRRPRAVRPPLSPLCMSQFALVTHTCSLIPYETRHVEAKLMTAATLMTEAAPQHPPASSPRRHHHHHHHHHRHHTEEEDGSRAPVAAGRPHRNADVEEECCRWLRNVDDSCVCDLLVLLPVFLSRPAHRYTVVVDDDCEVTFECPGRLIGP